MPYKKRILIILLLPILFLACTKEPAPDNGGGASSYDEHQWDWGDSIKRQYNDGEGTLDWHLSHNNPR